MKIHIRWHIVCNTSYDTEKSEKNKNNKCLPKTRILGSQEVGLGI